LKKSDAIVAGLLAALLAVLALDAEVIDRIAVSVGNLAIATSDLDRQIRVTAFLDRTQPDFSPAARRAMAERLVDQKLILRELDNSRYPAPAAAEVDPIFDKFKKDSFPSDEEYRRALANAGVSEQDVKDVLLWQRRLLLFVDVRFRPGVQVSVQEIQDYYTKVVEPAARAAHPGEAAALENYRGQIEEKLTGQQTDQQMETWLANARQRTEVVFHDEAFQ
jgi:Fe-S cluster assembly scaffold protein SufB